MGFTVLYDANVLYPAPLRDLLVRIGMAGIVRVKWSEQILDEVFRNLLANRPDLTAERLARTRRLMNDAVRDVRVSGYESIIGSLVLPDPEDRHVLAAAIRGGAQVILTHNLRDFPPSRVERYGIRAVLPDEFVLGLLDLAPGAVIGVLHAQQAALRNPPQTLEDLLCTLENNGLRRSVAEVRVLTCS